MPPPATTPHIPLELHTLILSHLPAAPAAQHLPFLWRTCRSTSRLLRAAAERVFVARHLRHPRTRVRFPLGARAVETTVYEMEVVLGFAGFADEGEGAGEDGGAATPMPMPGSRAVFRDARPAACFGAGVLEATRARWREVVEGWAGGGGPAAAADAAATATMERKSAPPGSDGEQPVTLHPAAWAHWVEIRGLALDAELPDLRIDYEKREISFDWRRMLDEFFGEEAYARRCLEDMLEERSQLSLTVPSPTNSSLQEHQRENDEASRATTRRVTGTSKSLRPTHTPGENKARADTPIGDALLNSRREMEEDEGEKEEDDEELERRAYLAARHKRIERWEWQRQRQRRHRRYRKEEEGKGSPDNDDGYEQVNNELLPSNDDLDTSVDDDQQQQQQRERVIEMLKLREDLAKDVSICDNANEVRAVYRWNPEHDDISIW